MHKSLRHLVSAALLSTALGAAAHVVLETPSAPAGSSYRAVLRVGHGCEGSPTKAIRVLLPDGLRGAKPMPKPGWTLTMRREPLAQPYTSHGKTVREDVVEISWTATAREYWLQDDWYDEFILRFTLPQEAGAQWLRVVQQCEQGSLDWAQRPAQGTSTKDLKTPAALLEVLPAAAAHTH